MRLVDTHTHAWGADTDELPWKADALPPGWEGSYPHRDLVADMDRAGVDEAVVVSTPLYGRGRRTNEYTMRAIEVYPDRLYGVGIVDPFPGDPEAVRANLRRAVGHERMLGVRFHAAMAYETVPTTVDRTADWVADDALDPLYDEAARLDAAVFVLPKADQLATLAAVADAHPDVTFVVDHMGWVDDRTAPDEAPWTDFEDLAARDNAYVKLSSLPRSSDEGWPYADLHGYVRRLVEWFGPDRLLVGSDYPWMDDWAAYPDCLNWLDTVEFLSARDRAYLRYRTFDELFG
ncbi:amidohydrolase family protein [Candidatus Halobonum tyrrellensis]|uniref:Amidohydrolase n=1 Tax=Candidatus Halobonum tyrrellensis G22 TaxID=1324957 RepID=V4HGZ7_9EURY|nr:amidohydrolase family protein [Candidatus Halobonum tyrrellensis]ESP89995.1 amidohydrolase [Candidatus Halobonum tyrrellensis G22]